MSLSTADRFCILGAGTSGLAVAKNFLQGGIPFDCLEREDDIGGNWYFGKPASSIYASTHLISSKRQTEFTDFPMPKEYPEYPGCELVWDYLQDYVREFILREHIQFNTTIERIEPGDEGWRVSLAGGEQRVYRGVVIANGHNWQPRWPNYPGQFTGEVIHSANYKTPDVLRGKRALVVGGGNSGCDLAVEASIHARRALLSMRRGYHVLPKFFKGMPLDQFNERLLSWRLPLWMRRLGAKLVIRWVLGPPEVSGLPKPDHQLFESHPIINSQLHYRVAHGDLAIRPDVERLEGSRVVFVDGSEEEIDLIIYATGFEISFPFVDHEHLNWRDGGPDLFLHSFHPQRDDLFVAGLIQPDSGQWGLVDYQAQLITRYLQTLEHDPRRAEWFAKLKQTPKHDLNHGIRYIDSPRHRLEVEHFAYRRRLQKLIDRFG